MNFLNPFFLWSSLAITIPVAIHFLHQKRGKPLPWAATQWLTEARQQQSRGLRLDNIWLLLIRCLLLLLLAVMLAQLLLNWFTGPPTVHTVHLVQPNTVVADNFRFELTEAKQKSERVVWANEGLSELDVDKLGGVLKPDRFNTSTLQTAINQLDLPTTDLHLYVINNQALGDVPAITVPARFQLHTIIDSTRQPRPFLVTKGNRNIFINPAGKLTSSPALDPTLKFQPEPAHSGPINTLLSYRNALERNTVKAALLALNDVYGLDLVIDEKSKSGQLYDWVLTDILPTKPISKVLYTVSGTAQNSTFQNVSTIPNILTPQTSERVASGQLPEWLGGQLVQHFGLISDTKLLSRSDLNALFLPTTKQPRTQQAGIQNTLLLLFVGLLILERYVALTKNA